MQCKKLCGKQNEPPLTSFQLDHVVYLEGLERKCLLWVASGEPKDWFKSIESSNQQKASQIS